MERPQVLPGGFHGNPKTLGGVHREVGVAQQFARQQDDIRFAILDDRARLFRLGDHADCAGGDAGFGANLLRKRDLITGPDLDLCARGGAAGGAVDKVNARFVECNVRIQCSSRRIPRSRIRSTNLSPTDTPRFGIGGNQPFAHDGFQNLCQYTLVVVLVTVAQNVSRLDRVAHYQEGFGSKA